jgi:hypothetical protein
MAIKRVNGNIIIKDSTRGYKVIVPAAKVEEVVSLLKHAAAFVTEDGPAVARKKRQDNPAAAPAKRGRKKQAAEPGEKKKAPFKIRAEDGSKMKPGEFVKALVEAAKNHKESFVKVVDELSKYSTAKGDTNKKVSSERAVRMILRHPKSPFLLTEDGNHIILAEG